MRNISSVLSFALLVACSYRVAAQQPSSPPAPGTSVSQSCTDLKPRAKQECLKVARQMDSDAAAPETTSASSSVDTVHHSSSVMETPEERKAAAKSVKPSKPHAPKTAPPPKADEDPQTPTR